MLFYTFFIVLLQAATVIAQSNYLKIRNASFVPDAVLAITAEDINIGCISRYSVVVNGTSPGPELRFRTGDTVWIRVLNEMADANLTMHWHGLSMAASPLADGSPQASQWPIGPGHFFDYELSLVGVEPGTHFYHSHVDFQASTAVGPLIVEEADTSPHQYDDERTLIFTDLFSQTDDQIVSKLTANPFVWPGGVNAVLVNGYGRTDCIPRLNASGCTPLVWNVSSCGYARIEVTPGLTYRFRLIGATALSFLSIGVDGHSRLTVIEADGTSTKPVDTYFMQLASGQRFSVLLRTMNCSELAAAYGDRRQFYIRTETREAPTVTTAYTVLDYGGHCAGTVPRIGPEPLPTPAPSAYLPPTRIGFLDYVLEPLVPDNFPSLAEVTRRVCINMSELSRNGTVSILNNGVPWTQGTAPIPYLIALYQNSTNYLPNYDYALAHNGVDSRVSAFPAKIGEVLEIVLLNVAAEGTGTLDAHPMHMHGAHYWDIGSGIGEYNVTENEMMLAWSRPVRRDTTVLYRNGSLGVPGEVHSWRAWRIRVEDPGVWMMHCHTLHHMIMGMQAVWVFGDPSDIMEVPRPMVDGYMTFGGDAYGTADHDPTVVHFTESDVEADYPEEDRIIDDGEIEVDETIDSSTAA